MVGFGISSVEPSSSTTIKLVISYSGNTQTDLNYGFYDFRLVLCTCAVLTAGC
jgi:hypothetical protein